MPQLQRMQTMSDAGRNTPHDDGPAVDWTQFDEFRENSTGDIESVNSDDSEATDEFFEKDLPLFGQQDESTKSDSGDESSTSEELLSEPDNYTVTQYIVELGLGVGQIDQNELSEVIVSMEEFEGGRDPTLGIKIRDDQLFRRVFSNLVQGRFPSSFRVSFALLFCVI